MPRGKKQCPSCKEFCGPRAFKCSCGHAFPCARDESGVVVVPTVTPVAPAAVPAAVVHKPPAAAVAPLPKKDKLLCKAAEPADVKEELPAWRTGRPVLLTPSGAPVPWTGELEDWMEKVALRFSEYDVGPDAYKFWLRHQLTLMHAYGSFERLAAEIDKHFME